MDNHTRTGNRLDGPRIGGGGGHPACWKRACRPGAPGGIAANAAALPNRFAGLGALRSFVADMFDIQQVSGPRWKRRGPAVFFIQPYHPHASRQRGSTFCRRCAPLGVCRRSWHWGSGAGQPRASRL